MCEYWTHAASVVCVCSRSYQLLNGHVRCWLICGLCSLCEVIDEICVWQTLHDDITSQRSKARDVLSTIKRLSRDMSTLDNDPVLHDKMDDLQRQSNSCAKLSADRLCVLEQAVPLTSDFHEANDELSAGLDKLEDSIRQPEPPSVTAEHIREQQEQVKVSWWRFSRLSAAMWRSWHLVELIQNV